MSNILCYSIITYCFNNTVKTKCFMFNLIIVHENIFNNVKIALNLFTL